MAAFLVGIMGFFADLPFVVPGSGFTASRKPSPSRKLTIVLNEGVLGAAKA
jgi:hypothetical protein